MIFSLHLKLYVHYELMSLGHTLHSVCWIFCISLGTWSCLRAGCLMTGTSKSYWLVRMAKKEAWKEKRRQENLKSKYNWVGLGRPLATKGQRWRNPDMMLLHELLCCVIINAPPSSCGWDLQQKKTSVWGKVVAPEKALTADTHVWC